MPSVPSVFVDVAHRPHEYARHWKSRSRGPVVGTFPMHFPAEVIHAAGALTVVVQDFGRDRSASVTGSFYPFFCGYTRSVVDQAIKGQLDFLDAIMFGDHCVQMLSAADVVRVRRPHLHVGFHQLIPALKDNWSLPNAERTLRACIARHRDPARHDGRRRRPAREHRAVQPKPAPDPRALRPAALGHRRPDADVSCRTS